MILHIAEPNKFSIPLFRIIERELNYSDHVVTSRENYSDMKIHWEDLHLKNNFIGIVRSFWKADKIIIHGLRDWYLLFLIFQPWTIKKSFWVMWGWDVYNFRRYNELLNTKSFFSLYGIKTLLKEFLRIIIIPRLRGLISYVEEDVDLIRSIYKTNAEYFVCMMYESNIFKDRTITSTKSQESQNILAGNSASPENRHLEIFKKISSLNHDGTRIYCPLSYGDEKYREFVLREGERNFGESFVPMLEFLDLDNYLNFLETIDIVIFAHNRQQGMGNLINLLGMGKKVYLRSGTTTWKHFERINVKVFDINNFCLDPIDENIKKLNIQNIKSYYSYENLIIQLKTLFNS